MSTHNFTGAEYTAMRHQTMLENGRSNMTQHTPGPWATERIDGRFEITANHRPNSWWSVARLFTDEPQDEANARLIAAAPDLLAVVKAIATMSVARHAGDPHLSKTIEAARAAIAKATEGK